jgi:hypothetical protein
LAVDDDDDDGNGNGDDADDNNEDISLMHYKRRALKDLYNIQNSQKAEVQNTIHLDLKSFDDF